MKTRRRLRVREAIEETMGPARWRQYCRTGIATKAYAEDVKVNARWLFMKVRRAILEGSVLSQQEKLNDLRHEGQVDLLFSNTPPVNKAKLRVGKYTVTWCLRHVSAEMMHFIETGQVMKHSKHLTQDVHA